MVKLPHFKILSAHVVTAVTKVPVLNNLIKKCVIRFEEGSVVRISSGLAAGLLWRRYRHNVNAYWLGNYELSVQRRISLELKEEDVFFDIGANAGFFSLIAAKIVGERGSVIAFEPMPIHADAIEEQFRINKLNNCRCIPSAVGKLDGVRELIVPKRGDEKASLPTARLASTTGSINGNEEVMHSYYVNVTSLDSFVDREGLVPDLIKIDVEGGEGDVLHGGVDLIRSKRAPRILVETHGRDMAASVERQLIDAGYRFYDMYGKRIQNVLSEKHFIAYPPWVEIEPIMY